VWEGDLGEVVEGVVIFKKVKLRVGSPGALEGGKRVEKALALLNEEYMALCRGRKWEVGARTKELG